MKKRLLQFAAASVMSLGFALPGIASAQDTINTTGPDSTNKIEYRNTSTYRVDNNNRVNLRNNNPQTAYSGDAHVYHNTTARNVSTGMVHNDSLTSASVTLHNGYSATGGNMNTGGSGGASIGTTGPESYNKVEYHNSSNYHVNNVNNVDIQNTNEQTAISGDAHVSGNTTVGDVTTGDATNVSTNQFTVSIQNN